MQSRSLLFLAVMVACVGTTVHVRAETATLEWKRSAEDPWSGKRDQILFGVSSQHFWQGDRQTLRGSFDAFTKKQPEKYASDRPFKALVELGGKQFPLVLDSTDSAKGYNRLYFDANGNADLTDDKPIEPAKVDENRWSINSIFYPLTVALEIDGQRFDYAFWLRCSSNRRDDHSYVQLYPAACREGRVTLDGKEHTIAILDFNSNGCFNDEFKVDPKVRASGDTVWPEYGDIVVIDPDRNFKDEYYWDVTSGPNRQYLSKLVNIEGRFYGIQVTPSGDKVTLTPAKMAMGTIRNSSPAYRAVLYGDEGIIKIDGRSKEAVVVPEGDWQLLACCVESAPGTTKPARQAAEAGPTRLTARGVKECKSVQVRKGKLVDLPFGPPYKVLVHDLDRDDRDLSMYLVGTGGEVCSNLLLNGDQPPEPSFVILDSAGDVIERGQFEYG